MTELPPMKIRAIDHVVLRSADVPGMLRFYRDVLGCHVEKEQPKLGLTQLRAGTSLIDLVDLEGVIGRQGGAGPGSEGRNLDHFCLQVAPFDGAAIATHLESHGVATGEVVSRYGAEGQGPSMYIQDPEGNMVELKGPPDKAA